MQQHIQSLSIICDKVFNSKRYLIRHSEVHEWGKNFNAKKDLRYHKHEHKRKNKTRKNGEEEDIDDMIESAEFILNDADDIVLRDDNIAIL